MIRLPTRLASEELQGDASLLLLHHVPQLIVACTCKPQRELTAPKACKPTSHSVQPDRDGGTAGRNVLQQLTVAESAWLWDLQALFVTRLRGRGTNVRRSHCSDQSPAVSVAAATKAVRLCHNARGRSLARLWRRSLTAGVDVLPRSSAVSPPCQHWSRTRLQRLPCCSVLLGSVDRIHAGWADVTSRDPTAWLPDLAFAYGQTMRGHADTREAIVSRFESPNLRRQHSMTLLRRSRALRHCAAAVQDLVAAITHYHQLVELRQSCSFSLRSDARHLAYGLFWCHTHAQCS